MATGCAIKKLSGSGDGSYISGTMASSAGDATSHSTISFWLFGSFPVNRYDRCTSSVPGGYHTNGGLSSPSWTDATKWYKKSLRIFISASDLLLPNNLCIQRLTLCLSASPYKNNVICNITMCYNISEAWLKNWRQWRTIIMILTKKILINMIYISRCLHYSLIIQLIMCITTAEST